MAAARLAYPFERFRRDERRVAVKHDGIARGTGKRLTRLLHGMARAQLRLLPCKVQRQGLQRPALDLRLHPLGLVADDHHRPAGR